MVQFVEILREKSKGEGDVAQTGSSYDGLHLSRLLQLSSGKHVFYPPIDFDFMMTYVKYKILDKSDDKSGANEVKSLVETSQDFAIMVPSSYPGYVKLLITENGKQLIKKPKCEFEKYITEDGYIPNFVFKTKLFPGQYDKVEVLYQRENAKYVTSGPALSDYSHESDGYSYDFVHSFPCLTWPNVAINWTRRTKPTGWPSNELIREITKDGCGVVPIGHHLSGEADLEWRISYNSAERKLSRSLSPRQRSCYSLVKFLLKTGLSQTAILTSYHVKNIMFWYCEQMYGVDEWTEELQGQRILDFIDYIIKCLANYNIPQYFHPPNNLIVHRSKDDIDKTQKEVVLVKERIFHTFVLTLCKQQFFDKMKGVSERGEVENMLLLYTTFVQTLYKLGFMNIQQPIAERCFYNVVSLNRSVRSLVKVASPAYSAQSVPELLKSFGLAYTRAGETENALAVYEIMVRTDKTTVESQYPEVYTNIGCLYNLKYSTSTKENDKSTFLSRSEDYFQKALGLINDSPSLHTAYGCFLLFSKSNPKLAIEQFQASLAISKPRTEDDMIVQLELPSRSEVKPLKSNMAGKVASCYLICDCMIKADDIYEARRVASLLEKIVKTSPMKQKQSDLQICSLVYEKCGLHVKAELVKNESTRYAGM
ncbi:uncharacterized protein LOC133179071 [Saccostrea echinata]|uniref:uncharacterized protein LOC133179071 n=1 Tax=Saccostrea echinata TaxID=191078 RepID=UPI002A81AB13|nr:uncharacterized protein LOC133179071 [Saccostrea echinata]